MQSLVLDPSCNLYPVSGPCGMNLPRYYYDPAANFCSLFRYGGCMGNGNNFDTMDECDAHCMQ